jgi:hypothetical protein
VTGREENDKDSGDHEDCHRHADPPAMLRRTPPSKKLLPFLNFGVIHRIEEVAHHQASFQSRTEHITACQLAMSAQPQSRDGLSSHLC